ncbi:unnamed protein product, partial [Chrysoparadoxa australica]
MAGKRAREPGDRAGMTKAAPAEPSPAKQKKKRKGYALATASAVPRSQEVTFKVVSGEEGGKEAVPPMVVSFPGQILPTPAESKSLAFQLHGSTDPKRRKRQRLVVGNGEDMDYWGANFGPTDSQARDCTKCFVGARRKGSQTVKVFPVGHIYALKQNAREAGDNTAAENSEMTVQERRGSLIKAFGNKKRQAQLKSRESNRISAETVVGGSSLGRVLARVAAEAAKEAGKGDEQGGTKEPESAMEKAFEGARRNLLPAYNTEADTPEGVYSLSSIITGDLRRVIKADLDAAVKESGSASAKQFIIDWLKEDKSAPRYVLAKLAAAKDRKSALVDLLYLRHMLTFQAASNFLTGTAEELAERQSMPELVMRHLLELFALDQHPDQTVKRSFAKVKKLKDKICIYILCTCLVMEGCSFDFSMVASDMKLKTAEASVLLRELGATTAGTKASLKVKKQKCLALLLALPAHELCSFGARKLSGSIGVSKEANWPTELITVFL